ncbi:MAG: cyclic nucleotide-binding domain-containing protein [Solirubrobacteraceae bacterium]
MSEAIEVPGQVLEYVQAQQTLTLATASPTGVPRAGTFLYVNDGPTLYFWSRAATITTRQLAQNPIVAFTIDSYTDDLNQTKGVQGVGECSVLLSGEQIARVADLFGQKFPNLAPGSTMSISFFRLTPTELQFIDNTQAAPTASGAFGAEFHRERSYSVLQTLPLRPAQTIVATLPVQSVKAGETVVRAGTPADKFFIIVSGEAELARPDGEKLTLGPGRLFGEVTIMRDQPRAATVTATSDLELLALDRDTFRDLISQAMEITPDFDQVIRDRLDAS